MTRRVLIVLLAGVNLLLLAGLVSTVYSPPAAFGQVQARGSDYLLVTTEVEPANDVLYLIDSHNKRMYAFRTTYPRMPGTPARFALLAQRDLTGDFRKER